MEIPVLIEPVLGDGYRATGGEPFAVSAEGATRDEALARLRHLIAGRFSAGAEVVALQIPAASHPWEPFAGMLRDEPLFDEWQRAIQEAVTRNARDFARVPGLEWENWAELT